MQYITAAQAAEKWGVTVRRIQDLCRNNKIHGAVRFGRDWMIPADAPRPQDGRRKQEEKTRADHAQLHRKHPVILLSNLYHTPGSADQVAASLEDRPASAALFRAQLYYVRGDIRESMELIRKILEGECGHDLLIGCGITMINCAIYLGDASLWKEAKELIAAAPCHSARDRLAVDFWLGAAQSALRETVGFPLWFLRGRFDLLPGDSFPSARFYYLRLMYLLGHEYAMGHHGQPDEQARMSLFSCVAEPLIAQNHKEAALVSEVYTRLICASSYHDLGMDSMAIHHLDEAIALALPDRLYMPLAEYRRQLDFLLEDRLTQADPAAAAAVRGLNKIWLEGWTKLQSMERGKTITNDLTAREREVAKNAAFGLSNKEIADKLGISVNTVKQSLRMAMDKTGALRRSDLAHYI